MKILLYNKMFGAPHDYDPGAIPTDWEITENRRQIKDADAVVFHVPNSPRILLPRKRAGQIWVAWTMECDEHYPRMRNPKYRGLFDLFMTCDADSDVPVWYCPENLFEAPRGNLTDKSDDRMICSFISGRFDKSGRGRYLSELAQHMNLHAYGKHGTHTIENDNGRESKLDTIARYKFTIAFENSIARDYVTEKFFDPLVAGSVPVYLGAENVVDFSPSPNCYIDAADFDSPRELARKLHAIAADGDEYARLFSWREQPIDQAFQERYAEFHRDHLLRLCEAVARVKGVAL